MQKIPLNLAKPGMKLAKAILRDNGTTVMAEGMELSASLISRLENMKIERIVVQGRPLDLDGSGGENWYAVRARRLDHLFRAHGSDRWMIKLKAALKGYFQLKAAATEAAEQAEAQIEAAEQPEPDATQGNGE